MPENRDYALREHVSDGIRFIRLRDGRVALERARPDRPLIAEFPARAWAEIVRKMGDVSEEVAR